MATRLLKTVESLVAAGGQLITLEKDMGDKGKQWRDCADDLSLLCKLYNKNPHILADRERGCSKLPSSPLTLSEEQERRWRAAFALGREKYERSLANSRKRVGSKSFMGDW